MRFTMYPVDRRSPKGRKKLVLHSGVSFLRVLDLGEGGLDDLPSKRDGSIQLKPARDIRIRDGHVYLTYHTHWKHWTMLQVSVETED